MMLGHRGFHRGTPQHWIAAAVAQTDNQYLIDIVTVLLF